MKKTSIVVGVDPDSDKHGVAVYIDRKLKDLHMMNRHEFIEMIKKWVNQPAIELVISIENVLASPKVVFQDLPVNAKVKRGIDVGMCKQAQSELMDDISQLGGDITCLMQKPASTWKKDASARQFKMITGWTKRSNEDTRSAAYFGFIALNGVAA